MSSVKEMRIKYGLTQPQLAQYLSVTLGLLKMAEIGRRMLPTSALLKLFELAMLLLPPLETFDKTNSTSQKIQKEIEDCRFAAMKLQRQLEVMKKDYVNAANQLVLANHLLLKLIADDEGKKDKIWLELLQSEATAVMQKCGLEEQAYLEWKIGWMEFGIRDKGGLLIK